MRNAHFDDYVILGDDVGGTFVAGLDADPPLLAAFSSPLISEPIGADHEQRVPIYALSKVVFNSYKKQNILNSY